MRRYTVLIMRDPEGNGYSVEVPALPGCFSQGATFEEALEHAHEAVEVHIAGLIQDGEPVPEETSTPQLAVVEVADGMTGSAEQLGAPYHLARRSSGKRKADGLN